MRIRRHLKAVVLREQGKEHVTLGFPQRRDDLLIEDIAKPLVEQQRENGLIVVPRINRPPQESRIFS